VWSTPGLNRAKKDNCPDSAQPVDNSPFVQKICTALLIDALKHALTPGHTRLPVALGPAVKLRRFQTDPAALQCLRRLLFL
jgi:hypothetical protein